MNLEQSVDFECSISFINKQFTTHQKCMFLVFSLQISKFAMFKKHLDVAQPF